MQIYYAQNEIPRNAQKTERILYILHNANNSPGFIKNIPRKQSEQYEINNFQKTIDKRKGFVYNIN